LSRLKNMSGAGWVVTGIAVTLLLVPTGVAAKGLKVTGIIGTSGNKADVTTTGQLQVGETSPTNFYTHFTPNLPSSYGVVAAPPSGDSLIIKSAHPTWGGAPSLPAEVDLAVFTGACTSQVAVVDIVAVGTTPGVVSLSYEPGFVVPGGDTLCARVTGGGAAVSVNGYVVPSADAPLFAAPSR